MGREYIEQGKQLVLSQVFLLFYLSASYRGLVLRWPRRRWLSKYKYVQEFGSVDSVRGRRGDCFLDEHSAGSCEGELGVA